MAVAEDAANNNFIVEAILQTIQNCTIRKTLVNNSLNTDPQGDADQGSASPVFYRTDEDQGTVSGLSRVIGGLAHEIKNPLSTITLNLKLLSEDVSKYEDEEHCRINRRLDVVLCEANRVKQILDDFLKCAGKYEVRPINVDIREILEDLRDFYSPQAEASRVLVRMTLPETPVICCIDVKLIKQAVLNIMLNAVEAMKTGGELLIKLSTVDKNVIMELIDTGPGIPSNKIGNIFLPYFSTSNGGTGLGLPIAKRIIKDHKGKITVESEDGKGTRFIITLPLS